MIREIRLISALGRETASEGQERDEGTLITRNRAAFAASMRTAPIQPQPSGESALTSCLLKDETAC
jgi:hypothetical protein